jgi:hypothetical protein
MTEAQIQRAICEYLTWKKHLFWRNNAVARFDPVRNVHYKPLYTPKGLPDIMLIRSGCFVGLEVKADKGRQSQEQKEFERRVKEEGGEYYLVRSVEDVQALGL